jgi:hypothetical protein
MDESEDSGAPRWGDDIAKEVLERLQRFDSDGDADTAEGSPPTGPATANGDGDPPKVKRHPEDPHDAVADAGQEVTDPEQIRIKAARLGTAAQAIGPDYFEWLTRPLYRWIHQVRAGAVVMPGQREAAEQLKISAATDAELAGIRAGGAADEKKADRIEAKAISRNERDLEDAKAEVVKARERLETCRERVEVLQEADEREGRVEGTTRVRRRFRQRRSWEGRGGLFGRISLSPRKALAVFIAEVLGTALVLATKVADVFETSLEMGAAIAVALSLAILVASFVAAMAAAAIRLPGRLVGLLLVAAYAAVLFKLVPGLDALREADTEGVKAMTAATLAACFVAGFTGYVTATREDRHEEVEERELKQKAGTPLRHAMRDLEEADEAHARAQRRVAQIEHSLAELWEEVERFRDAAQRAEVTVSERRRLGVEADAEAAAIEAIVATGVGQERAAAGWATSIALLAHEKTRLEEPPDENELRIRLSLNGAGRTDEPPKRLSAMQQAALAVLGAGGIASLALGVAPLGIGVPVAVLMFVIDRERSRGKVASASEQELARAGIVSPASDESEPYERQPRRMFPKYRDGGDTPGERQ